MDMHHPAMRSIARCARSTDPVHDAGRFYDAQAAYTDSVHAEEERLKAETLAQARAGNYARLIDALDYRDNYQAAMRALVLCANKGNVEAQQAVHTLAQTYAELHAEVD